MSSKSSICQIILFTYANWLFGQTWTTFQILDLPEDLDFAGAADGIIFNRQPLIRYTMGDWQFAVENAETTLDPNGELLTQYHI